MRPGDELRLRTTVEEARLSRSKPDRGLVRTRVELVDQGGRHRPPADRDELGVGQVRLGRFSIGPRSRSIRRPNAQDAVRCRADHDALGRLVEPPRTAHHHRQRPTQRVRGPARPSRPSVQTRGNDQHEDGRSSGTLEVASTSASTPRSSIGNGGSVGDGPLEVALSGSHCAFAICLARNAEEPTTGLVLPGEVRQRRTGSPRCPSRACGAVRPWSSGGRTSISSGGICRSGRRCSAWEDSSSATRRPRPRRVVAFTHLLEPVEQAAEQRMDVLLRQVSPPPSGA